MGSAYKGPERRRFERIPVDLTITYKVHESLKIKMVVGEREIEAEVSDLSEGGMSIVTNYDIPISSILLMTFSLVTIKDGGQDRKAVTATGEVRYNILLGQAGHRLGISFSEISKDDKETISAFISNALSK